MIEKMHKFNRLSLCKLKRLIRKGTDPGQAPGRRVDCHNDKLLFLLTAEVYNLLLKLKIMPLSIKN